MNVFGNSHFLLLCNKEVANSVLNIITSEDDGIQVLEQHFIDAKRSRNRFVSCTLKRKNAFAYLGISVNGSSDNSAGGGEYWVFIDAPFSLSRKNVQFVADLRSILLANGARE